MGKIKRSLKNMRKFCFYGVKEECKKVLVYQLPINIIEVRKRTILVSRILSDIFLLKIVVLLKCCLNSYMLLTCKILSRCDFKMIFLNNAKVGGKNIWCLCPYANCNKRGNSNFFYCHSINLAL